MTTSDKLCIAIGPVLGLFLGMMAFNMDVASLGEANWVTVGVLPLSVLAGPNVVGLKYAIRAIRK